MRIYNLILLLIFLLCGSGSVTAQKLSLDDVIRIAMENNTQIKSAKLNVEKEKAAKLKSYNLPQPELFLEYEGVKGSLKNYESRKIGISQELEFPSSYFLRSDVQSSRVEIAKQELNKTAYNTRYEVSKAYLDLILNKKLLQIAEENLKIYTDFLFTAEKKFEAGSTANLEVLGAKVNKIKFQNEIKNIESGIVSAKSELRRLMGVSYFDIEPSEELTFLPLDLSKNKILRSALINNPEIKINSAKLENFSNLVSLSKSELLPNLTFKYYRQKIGDDGDFWGVELGLGLPLWFWLAPSANIRESGFELEIASNEQNGIQRDVENEVNQSFAEYENNLREAIFFHDEAVQEAGEILRQAKISYEEGAIGYVEYLQSLQLVYETRTQYIFAVYSYNKSVIKLENIAAGDLK